MNTLDKQYQDLLQTILDYGVEKKDRTGTGTKSIFGYTIRHNMKHGFPLLTTKKMYFKGIITELLWFLRGDTNIKYLVDNDCHIWDGDCYWNYLRHIRKESIQPLLDSGWCVEPNYPTKEEFINKIKTDDEFAKKWGDLGPVYGKQWRKWDCLDKGFINLKEGEEIDIDINHIDISHQFDQIANLIRDLKTNPDSRRLMVSAWNVGELDQMTLPPCHYGFQVYTRELSLEERLLLADKINKEIRQDLYSYAFNNPIYTGGIDQRPDDVERHHLLSDLNIPTRAISLMWNQRSVDTFLGLPFNIASYGLLLEIIAKEVNMVPDELIGNLGDTHLYLNHIEQAKEQIGRELSESERYVMFEDRGYEFRMNDWTSEEQYDKAGIPKRTREPYPLPKLVINDEFWNPDASLIEQIEHIEISDFEIRDYQSHPTIKAPLSN